MRRVLVILTVLAMITAACTQRSGETTTTSPASTTTRLLDTAYNGDHGGASGHHFLRYGSRVAGRVCTV